MEHHTLGAPMQEPIGRREAGAHLVCEQDVSLRHPERAERTDEPLPPGLTRPGPEQRGELGAPEKPREIDRERDRGGIGDEAWEEVVDDHAQRALQGPRLTHALRGTGMLEARVVTLHIALDATLDDAPTTGIGLYVRELGSALESMGNGVERMGAERSGDVPRGAMSRTVWTLAVLPRLLASRPLFHAIGNSNLPLRPPAGSRCVLTVHDLIPL